MSEHSIDQLFERLAAIEARLATLERRFFRLALFGLVAAETIRAIVGFDDLALFGGL